MNANVKWIVINKISNDYELIIDFDAYPGYIEKIEDGEMHYKGFIMKRK